MICYYGDDIARSPRHGLYAPLVPGLRDKKTLPAICDRRGYFTKKELQDCYKESKKQLRKECKLKKLVKQKYEECCLKIKEIDNEFFNKCTTEYGDEYFYYSINNYLINDGQYSLYFAVCFEWDSIECYIHDNSNKEFEEIKEIYSDNIDFLANKFYTLMTQKKKKE